MSQGKLLIALGLVILALMILTNPSESKQKEIIKEKLHVVLQEKLNQKITNDTDWSQVGKALGSVFGGRLLDAVVDEQVRVDDYLIFSIPKINYNGTDQKIGLAMFGTVFTDEEKLSAIWNR